ncbi:MAG: hypothetical protein LBR48_01950 [Dysgonamonadaceae bacterium]|jgi:hypothetical protein|nr:hypothetical protein [Dysgonamonadaceae bacterium]
MIIEKKSFLSLVALLTVAATVFGQNVGSDSPYGRYGYGSLSNPAIGAAESMGGIGYGLRRSQQVNPANPASYSRLDTLTFIFDMGISAQMAQLNDGTTAQNFKNGNLDYLAMQFPIIRKVGASIGLLPFSKVGYNYGKNYYKEDVRYNETYRGTGGLSRIYGGIAYAPFKNISLGVNVSYLFGDVSYSKTLTPVSMSGYSAYISQRKDDYTINTLMQEWGLQYSIPITRERTLTLGVVYTPKVSTKATIYPLEAMYSSDPYTYPTYNVPVEIIPTDTLAAQNFQLPQSIGAGFTYAARKFLMGVDGTYQQWKNIEYPSALDGMTTENRFNNVYRINAGMEYTIEPLSRNYLNRIRFRGGLSYTNSYANVLATDPATGNSVIGGFKEYGANIGIGFPIRDNLTGHVSMINVGFNYSLRQPDKSFMIKEETYRIFVNMNINEFWFFKRRFD